MIRTSLRALVLSGLAGTLLAGCATGYNYQAGPGGDYYYGQPEVHYNDPYWYGWGGWGGWGGYGWYGPYGYGYGYGGYPYGPYWGPPYYHWHRPVVVPPHNPTPPGHGPGGVAGDGDRGPDRARPPGPVVPGHPVVRPMPAPRPVTAPRPMTGVSEREPHRKTTP
jgi:hypothetical protein